MNSNKKPKSTRFRSCLFKNYLDSQKWLIELLPNLFLDINWIHIINISDLSDKQFFYEN